jgi:PAS domain S-box-containing protein
MDTMTRNDNACGPEDEMSFAEILLNISAQFINLPAEHIDPAIEDAQRRICEFCDLDRSIIWQWSQDDPDVLFLTHVYQSADSPFIVETTLEKMVLSESGWIFRQSEAPPIYMRMDARAFFPWTVDRLKCNETVAISRLDDLPEEAGYDREMFRRYATRSSLIIPLSVGGKPVGAITFASVRHETDWTETLTINLQRIAQTFANALERQRSDRNLRDSEARLILAAESADASLWNLFLNSGHIWTTENSWDLYGIPREIRLTLQRFMEFVHVDDRDRVFRAVQEVKGPGDRLLVEYRLLSADGTVHWVVSRGRLLTNDAGEPYCLTGATVDITGRKQMEEQLREHNREIEKLRSSIERENLYLQEKIKGLVGHGTIISHSAAMKNIISLARQVSGTDSTVLILGETGTGKELLARAIHEMSGRNGRPLITVNCASLPPTLIEAELFGREKGAYTGALTKMIGRFELADRSTIFLDEIGELPLELQSKLLRVIEDGIFQRLGSTAPIKTNLRIITATNRNLFEEVKSGRFRSDLYYRLNVFPIHIPPLRERPEDIPPLVWSLVREFQEAMGKIIDNITNKTMDALTSYHWPGNVRELRNVIERAMIISEGTTLEVHLPELVTAQKGPQGKALRDMEREQIMAVLAGTDWKIGGKGGAAELLDIERTTLYAKMKKLGIRRPT